MAMPMMRVDHREAIRARLDAAARVLLDVGLVRATAW